MGRRRSADGVPWRYSTVHGRHRPCCGGRCLVAHVDSDNNAVGASVMLIVFPTLAFVGLVPAREYAAPVGCAAVLLGLALGYLFAALATEPGILPPAPPEEEASEASDGVRRSRSAPRRVTHVLVGRARVPLSARRAKMCRQTENCVDGFDHYCPWVGNAVGSRNYRYFLAFLVSVSGLCVVVGGGAATRLIAWNGAGLDGDDLPPWRAVALVCLVIYTAVVFASVCSLACYHARLVAVNETTNENVRATYSEAENPRDLGCARNCATFFATRPPPSLVLALDREGLLVAPGGDGGDDPDDDRGSIELV